MVPQKEVQPPAEIAVRGDLTTADMVKVGREIMEGKGLCLTCHTIGKTGALRFPDLAGVDVRAKSRVPGLSDVEYFAQSLYEPNAFVVPGIPSGDAPDQPASDRPHRSGDPLRDRVPADSWRHADGHAADETPLQQRRGRTGRRAASRGGSGRGAWCSAAASSAASGCSQEGRAIATARFDDERCDNRERGCRDAVRSFAGTVAILEPVAAHQAARGSPEQVHDEDPGRPRRRSPCSGSFASAGPVC